MIQIDWGYTLGLLLIVGGAVVLLGMGLRWAVTELPKRWPKPSPTLTDPEQPHVRSADEPPPPGGVDWVMDIANAMGSADAADTLECLTLGYTRDQAQRQRIADLEEIREAQP